MVALGVGTVSGMAGRVASIGMSNIPPPPITTKTAATKTSEVTLQAGYDDNASGLP